MKENEYIQKSAIPAKPIEALFGAPVRVVPTIRYVGSVPGVDTPSVESVATRAQGNVHVVENSWKSKVREIDFDELCENLVGYEKKFGISTIEMFQQYLAGKIDDDKDDMMEDWVDTYMLYLGCSQIRQYSCP